MATVLTQFELSELLWIGVAVFLLGVGKGGFPLGGLAMPILILMWPDPALAARIVVAFMLPLLCGMDLVSLLFYRRHVRWSTIVPLIPGTLAGVALASALFVSDTTALIAVSDRILQVLIGGIGIAFVGFRAANAWILRQVTAAEVSANPGRWRAAILGFAAGLLSTLSHAAGPAAIIYFVPQRLGKLGLAGTMVAFFWGLNLIKLAPFGLLGRLQTGNLMLALLMAPMIPLGVGTGYALVRLLQERSYIGLVYAALLVTSGMLIHRAVSG